MATEKTPLLSSDSGSKTPSVGYAPVPKSGDEASPVVTVRELFRFSDGRDTILLTLGALGCILYGILTPAQFILFGSLTQDFIDFAICQSTNCSDPVDLEDSMTTVAIWYVGLAVGNFLFSWLGIGLFGYSAERQVHKIKLRLFRNVIHQEIGWFDSHSTGEVLNRLSEDINRIGDGIGAKFGRIICSLVGFLVGYIIGYIYSWRLTLVMKSMFPLMIIVGAAMAWVTGSYTHKELEAYSRAGHVAEQSISSIRTVAAFGGERKQGELYESHLDNASNFGVKKGLGLGLGMGCFQLVLYSNIALALWYCVKLVRDGDADAGDGITVFFAITVGSMATGQAAPSFEALGVARASAYTVFKLIDRVSKIDASSYEGTKPAHVNGDVEFSNIDFVYPSRPNIQILKGFNLKVPSGKRVALVGESGCGKSTVVKLVQRFYDPVAGSVKLDGSDIKTLNVGYLRSLIGVVNQEPVLFATSIAANIALGKEGATRHEIEQAAKLANAHSFISQFPKGYDTLCGERGAKMSGGQKQRIAIARALVRNPKILLLDEATSALDTESEGIVQDALNKAGEGRTTIIIAHRLSTIKNADMIVSVRHGSVAETGTHEELMALDGIYSSLVRLQDSAGVGAPEKDDDDDEEEDTAEERTTLDVARIEMASVTTGSTYTASHRSAKHEEEKLKSVSLLKILQKNAPEWHYILFGCFGAALFGMYPPLWGLSLGGVFDALSHNPKIPEEKDDMLDEGRKWALFYFFTGVESGIGIIIQYYCLAKAGEALTKRLRMQTFMALLRQEISYFDKPANGTGAVCTRLAVEVSKIQGATGAQFGLLSSSIVTILGACVISFSYSWKLTLAMLSTVPLVLIGGSFFNAFLGGGTLGPERLGVGQVAEEAISNIHTVVSLGREEDFFERFREAEIEPYKNAKRSSHIAGLANGTLIATSNISFAVGFRYGGHLISEGEITVQDLMTTVTTVIVSAIVVGQVFSMTPDYSKAKEATKKIFSFLDKTPAIDSYSDEGTRPSYCNGEIRLANVRFRYPTRRNVKVLRNLSFDVQPGQTVALVGTSGCGKSTSVSLVERFYDARGGSVMVDGKDVKELNLKWLRSQIGIVSQEPVLFDLSIRDNIAYGDTTRLVSDTEIEEAAKAANIHDFISKLPQRYDTMVGDRGTLISGGQKQRIAIARALLRDPKILLLDEATSALDTESEKVVQQALDKASIGRTTLVIAHRLSTIQHADAIMVIRRGKVIERGNHQQLLALKGVYYALHRAQSLSA